MSSKKIENVTKFMFAAKSNISNAIKIIIKCFLDKNRPNMAITNKLEERNKYFAISYINVFNNIVACCRMCNKYNRAEILFCFISADSIYKWYANFSLKPKTGRKTTKNIKYKNVTSCPISKKGDITGKLPIHPNKKQIAKNHHDNIAYPGLKRELLIANPLQKNGNNNKNTIAHAIRNIPSNLLVRIVKSHTTVGNITQGQYAQVLLMNLLK